MVNHPTADIFLDHDGYAWVKFHEKAELDIACANDLIDIFEEVCDGVKRGFIVDTRGSHATSTREFREVIGNDPRALKWRKCDAILVNSLHKRMVASFYMKFNTPNLPVKIFGTEEDAKDWLSTY